MVERIISTAMEGIQGYFIPLSLLDKAGDGAYGIGKPLLSQKMIVFCRNCNRIETRIATKSTICEDDREYVEKYSVECRGCGSIAEVTEKWITNSGESENNDWKGAD